MLRAKDSTSRSLLAFAAESSDEGIFKAVWGCLKEELTKDEVWQRFKNLEESGS